MLILQTLTTVSAVVAVEMILVIIADDESRLCLRISHVKRFSAPLTLLSKVFLVAIWTNCSSLTLIVFDTIQWLVAFTTSSEINLKFKKKSISFSPKTLSMILVFIDCQKPLQNRQLTLITFLRFILENWNYLRKLRNIVNNLIISKTQIFAIFWVSEESSLDSFSTNTADKACSVQLFSFKWDM